MRLVNMVPFESVVHGLHGNDIIFFVITLPFSVHRVLKDRRSVKIGTK